MERIRIGNRAGGAIEVSLDGGQRWATVGRVTKPATDTGAGAGLLASAAPGAVAAIGLDGITARLGPPGGAAPDGPRIFRLLPAGAAPAPADIGTDLPRGQAIFGSLAPPLGSKLLLERAAGDPRPLPRGYVPKVGDHLVMVARVAVSAPAMLVFENQPGGRVLSVSPSGDETVVGQVLRPVRGVAPYAATAGAACGGVVLHRPGAVEVATAPAGAGGPGGFLIEAAAAFGRSGVQALGRLGVQAGQVEGSGGPLAVGSERPNARTPERPRAESSVLVVDRLAATGPAFGVPIALSPLGGSLAGETRVEARLDGGPWEPLPAAGGAAPDAFTAAALTKAFAALGAPRRLAAGVTHLRLVLAPPSPERLRAALAQAVVETGARVAAAVAAPPEPGHSIRAAVTHPKMAGAAKRPTAKPPHKATKTLRVVANIQGHGIVYVMFYVDGQIRKVTNTPPFDWLWDTRATPNGTHTLEIRGADVDGRIVTSQTQQVVVFN